MPLPADNYIVARDTSEADRLNVQHRYMISCQGYYFHPDVQFLNTGARIADVCTGTAISQLEIAKANPAAECHGFNVSDKMFPAQFEVSKNIELDIANAKQPFENRWLCYFDVVHIRRIEAAMRKEDWASVLRNLTTLLNPGFWLQWVEDDGGKLRKDWALMGIAAFWSLLKLRKEAGDSLIDISRDELAEGFLHDVAIGERFVTRVAVFTGRRKRELKHGFDRLLTSMGLRADEMKRIKRWLPNIVSDL